MASGGVLAIDDIVQIGKRIKEHSVK
jgi:hypothetical protein